MILRRHFLGATATAGLLPLAAREADGDAFAKAAHAPRPAEPVEPVQAMRQVIEFGEGGRSANSLYLTVPESCARIDVFLPDGKSVWSETARADGSWSLDGGAVRATKRDRAVVEFNLLHRKATTQPAYYAVVFRLGDGKETWMAINSASRMVTHRADFYRPTTEVKKKWFADRSKEHSV